MERAAAADAEIYRVDDLIVDAGQRRVFRGDTELQLPGLSFDLLLALVRAAPNLLTHDELMQRVWPGLVINSETVSQRVKLVRQALGDDPQAPRYIVGVRGRGYRLKAPVIEIERPLRAADKPCVAAPAPEVPKTPEPATVVPLHGNAVAAQKPLEQPAAIVGTPFAQSPDAHPAAPAAAPSGRANMLRSWLFVLVPVAAALAFILGHRFLTASNAPVASTSVVVREPKSVAVLPLIGLSPDRKYEYLGDGLAEELSSRLARIPGLRVASRTSAFAFKDRGTDVRTIGQKLGVEHVVEGSIRREGDRLRVTAQLIDARTGFELWSQSYDRRWRDVLAVQDELAHSIVEALQLVLTPDAARRLEQSRQPVDLAAYDLYLAGLARLRQPRESALDEAEQAFLQALSADPHFARANAGLCRTYVTRYERTRAAAAAAQAESACGQALSQDPAHEEVQTALANLYLISGRSERALDIFSRAIGAHPDSADAFIGYARALEALRRYDEAERAYRAAIDAQPGYWDAHTALGNFLLHQGRVAEAVVPYRRVTELVPASALAFNNLGAALLLTGDFSGAAQAFERSLELEPTRSACSNAGTVYYFMGRLDDAERMFTRATEIAGEDHRVWGNLADALYRDPARRDEAARHYRRAILLAERDLAVNDEDAVTWAQLGYYYARIGDLGRAQQYVKRARSRGSTVFWAHYYFALVALAAGDRSAAVEDLRQALELGYPRHLLAAEPEFASLRDDRRFRELTLASQSP
jgi:Predicted integral membrane protein